MVDIGQLESEELERAKRLFAGNHTKAPHKNRLPKGVKKIKSEEWIENMLSGNDNPRTPEDGKQIQEEAMEFVKKLKNAKK